MPTNTFVWHLFSVFYCLSQCNNTFLMIYYGINCLFTKVSPFLRLWQTIINKSDYLHWIKYTRQIYQLYTNKHIHTKMNWNNANITHTAECCRQKLLKKVTQVWWFSEMWRKSARTLVDGNVVLLRKFVPKKGRKVRKNEHLKQNTASLPVFVDVLFWEPQTRRKNSFILISVLITV